MGILVNKDLENQSFLSIYKNRSGHRDQDKPKPPEEVPDRRPEKR